MSPEESRLEKEARAESERSAGREREALALYEQILESDLTEGRFSRAVAVYQRVILWKPVDDELHRRLARRIAEARERMPSGAALGALPETALLAGIPSKQLAVALEKMVARRFPAGTVIIREGEPGDALHLITEGRVEVETRDEVGDRVVLGSIGTGDFFGEISLLTSRPRTATVTALTEVETLELSRPALVSLRAAYPDLERALAEAQRSRAERTAEALIEQRRRRS